MPFYEYQCKQCGHQLEAMQKINDAPLRKCPECGKSALQRLMSAPVFRLKGSGWYETDFKSDDEGKRNLAGGDEAEPVKAAEEKAGDKAVGDKKDGKEDKQATDKGKDKAADKPTESPAKKSEAPASKGAKTAKKPLAAKPSPARKPAKRAASASTPKKSAKRAGGRR